MITAFYAAILILLHVFLSFRVIATRGQHKVSLGSNGHPDLEQAIRAQGNLSEYAPLAVLALLILETQGFQQVALHALGFTFCAGRFLHAWAFLGDKDHHFARRVWGMRLTLGVLITSAVLLIGIALASVF